MKTSGKILERLVRLIQDTLNDSPNIIVGSNVKIKNASGRNREFYLVIKTSVND